MTRPLDDLIFRPRSVLVYGASSDPDKLSGRPLAYLQRFGFAGEIYAVNPRRREVQGVPAYASVADVPGPVDLAVVVVPADAVVEAVTRCADAGVGAAIIFASGFAEIGEKGLPAQEEIAAAAARTGMRLLGPNCLGSFCAATRAFATFSTAFDDGDAEGPDSPIALVSQSGAVGTFTFSTMNSLGLGVRYFANTGNESDITTVEVLRSLLDAPDVDVLLGHLEGVRDPAALEDLARAAAERGKLLALLKAGRTAAGSRAVAAHTASVAGDDHEFSRVLAEHGGVRAESMEDLADVALAFAGGRRTAGRRLTIVTQSGGAGALASDTAVELGLVVDPWESDDRHRVAENLPYFGSVANPIDCTGSMINDVTILEKTLDVVCRNDETDAVLVVVGNSDKGADGMVATLQVAHASTSKPLFVAWTGGTGRPRRELLAAGVPTYPDPYRAVRSLGRLVEHSLGRGVAAVAG